MPICLCTLRFIYANHANIISYSLPWRFSLICECNCLQLLLGPMMLFPFLFWYSSIFMSCLQVILSTCVVLFIIFPSLGHGLIFLYKTWIIILSLGHGFAHLLVIFIDASVMGLYCCSCYVVSVPLIVSFVFYVIICCF